MDISALIPELLLAAAEAIRQEPIAKPGRRCRWCQSVIEGRQVLPGGRFASLVIADGRAHELKPVIGEQDNQDDELPGEKGTYDRRDQENIR